MSQCHIDTCQNVTNVTCDVTKVRCIVSHGISSVMKFNVWGHISLDVYLSYCRSAGPCFSNNIIASFICIKSCLSEQVECVEQRGAVRSSVMVVGVSCEIS